MIHVVIGAPCAGKSTFVRENAKSGDIVIDYDELARALGADGHLPSGDIKQAAFKARQAAIDYCIEAKCEAWIIHTSPTDEQREAYENAQAEFIELDTDLETCLQRARDDGRPEGTEQIIRDYFEAAKAAFFMSKRGAAMEFKSFKATVEDDGGSIRAYASTFDRVPDSVGDIVAPNAFDKTLAKWRETGKPIPLLWGHDTEDPFSNIGAAQDYGTDERGLWFVATFDEENDKAQYVRKLVKEGRVFQCSFAYAVKDSAIVNLEDGRKANELRELDLFEISIVQIPANQYATVEEVKAGRRNSAKDADDLRRIASAAAEIQEVVNGLLTDDIAETIDSEEEREEETEGAKSQAGFVDAYKQAIKAFYEGE